MKNVPNKAISENIIILKGKPKPTGVNREIKYPIM